jgi:hypothetical protein
MVLTPEITKKIASFVKKEPRTIQDIAKHISKSWVTAESYVEKIRQQTGLLSTKVFRAGTQGALKLVYWNYEGALSSDEVKEALFQRIRLGARKTDFDPLEIYQHIPAKNKRSILEWYDNPQKSLKQGLHQFLRQAESEICCFSGNGSWMNMTENGKPILSTLEELLKRKVTIRMVMRIDLASMENIKRLSRLMNKYPDQLDIRHATQPLRGFVIDGKTVRLKNELESSTYKPGEIKGNLRVFYQWQDEDWSFWTQQVFWQMHRNAPAAEQRMKELEKIF